MAAGVSAAKVGEWGVGPSGHHGRVPRDKGWTLHDVRTLAKEVGALSKLHLAAFEKTGKTGLRWAREALRARGIGTLSARNRMQPVGQ